MAKQSSKSARTLTDHDEIRRWAEEREAKPACVRGTGDNEDVGMIRLDFPGYSGGDSLEEISWDDWFQKFDESNLALLVQEGTANGERSNFNKLVNRESVGESPENQESRPDSESESGSRARMSKGSRRDNIRSAAKTGRSTSKGTVRGSSKSGGTRSRVGVAGKRASNKRNTTPARATSRKKTQSSRASSRRKRAA
jgi:hypothetical protein